MTSMIKTTPRVRRYLGGSAVAAAAALVLATQVPGASASTDVTLTGAEVAAVATTTPLAQGVSALSLSGAGSNALKLSWAAAPGAARYRISWSDQDGHTSWQSRPDYQASDSPVTLTGLTAGHTYSVSLQAYGADGRQSLGFFPQSVTRAVDGAPRVGSSPAGPSSIKVSAAGPTGLTVSWSAAPGAGRYRIAWSDVDTYAYQDWSSEPDYQASDSPVTLSGLLPGHDYRVIVQAVDPAGNLAPSAAEAQRRTAANPDVPPPGGTTITLTPGAPHTLSLSWTPAKGATKYRIHWSDPSKKRWTSEAPDYTIDDSPIVLTGLNALPTNVTVTPYNDGGTGPVSSADAEPRS